MKPYFRDDIRATLAAIYNARRQVEQDYWAWRGFVFGLAAVAIAVGVRLDSFMYLDDVTECRKILSFIR